MPVCYLAEQAFSLTFKRAFELGAGLNILLYFKSTLSHDFPEHHSRSVEVVAAAETRVHGDQFM